MKKLKINSIIKASFIVGLVLTTLTSFANNYSQLRQDSNEFALIMFTQAGCQYCSDMDVVLKKFISRHGWKIKYIDRKENALIAAKFNVEVTPTIVMIRRNHPGSWLPISYGVINFNEVERNVSKAIRTLKGERQISQSFSHEDSKKHAFDSLATSGDAE